MKVESPIRTLLINGRKTKEEITEDICRPMEEKYPKKWLAAMCFSCLLLAGGGFCIYKVIWEGIGMWGLNISVNWAWDITNFVWWIGIGHAGTFISAVLLLFRQNWRNSINRSAEAMTIAAVICSAFFIAIHLGRPWLIYWIFPIPNTYGDLWVNFHSSLVWDAFAILTYLIVSVLFWYIGLIPDLALLRVRTKGLRSKVYKVFSLNWDNSSWSWRRYEPVMKVLAGLATPLVISVHSVVSTDFASSIIAGWHSTIFPPYFVIGAILSGFAMVVTLTIIIRKVYSLENYITINHIDYMSRMIIFNSGLIGIAYGSEVFMAFYSGVHYEEFIYLYRMFGEYRVMFWGMIFFNVFVPQLLWIKTIRRNIKWAFAISIIVNIGMWLERFVIIVTSLSRGYLPSEWVYFSPTIFDIGTFVFTIGLFLFFYLLFAKFLPVINIFEVKAIAKQEEERDKKYKKRDESRIYYDSSLLKEKIKVDK